MAEAQEQRGVKCRDSVKIIYARLLSAWFFGEGERVKQDEHKIGKVVKKNQ